MEQLVGTARELYKHFAQNAVNEKLLNEGIYVSEEVRKEAMISVCQGKITLNPYDNSPQSIIMWEDVGSGVWRASIK